MCSYIRCVIMNHALFEDGDESEQVKHRLSKEVPKLKYDLKDQSSKADEAIKQLAEVTKKERRFRGHPG